MGCSDAPLDGGQRAPHQCPLGKLSMLPSLYTDVRSILMVLWAFKGNERSMFYTTIGGWDSHGTVDISTQLDYVDEAVGMLADELKDQGVWDDVAIVCLSDFGR